MIQTRKLIIPLLSIPYHRQPSNRFEMNNMKTPYRGAGVLYIDWYF